MQGKQWAQTNRGSHQGSCRMIDLAGRAVLCLLSCTVSITQAPCAYKSMCSVHTGAGTNSVLPGHNKRSAHYITSRTTAYVHVDSTTLNSMYAVLHGTYMAQ